MKDLIEKINKDKATHQRLIENYSSRACECECFSADYWNALRSVSYNTGAWNALNDLERELSK